MFQTCSCLVFATFPSDHFLSEIPENAWLQHGRRNPERPKWPELRKGHGFTVSKDIHRQISKGQTIVRRVTYSLLGEPAVELRPSAENGRPNMAGITRARSRLLHQTPVPPVAPGPFQVTVFTGGRVRRASVLQSIVRQLCCSAGQALKMLIFNYPIGTGALTGSMLLGKHSVLEGKGRAR
ncbi:hypothetical protein B0H16DRAFT_1828757 [Mycena metata]|uniref:Uncharacterized protein n=1 Tax=Mycena metata TaxID=1033252 RepID=A0AAD7J3T9_9AGAR|nr:hypothetical protein B0H16DRAFT_1828757 [Mycena metata]